MAPFAVLGVCTEEDWLTEIDYLPLNTSLMAPSTPLAKEVCAQLQAYLSDPRYTFDLSLHISGTVHQRRVWEQIQDIPCHRIIAKNGGLGGFMNARDGEPLEIKRWLLQHESI